MKAEYTEQSFERRYRLVREIIETVVLTVLMFVIINLAVQNFDVDGPSMEPTLHNQERIMVDKVSYRMRDPARGDVIVFSAPPNPSLNYVKRIIAVPGDVITIQKSTVILNGVTLTETYVAELFQGNLYPDVVDMRIPDGKYFVMGDGRVNSSDSRDWGLLPRENIIGRAALIYWPLGQDNTGFLPNVDNVYAQAAQKQTSAEIQNLPGSSVASPVVASAGVEMMAAPVPLLLLACFRLRKRRQRSNWWRTGSMKWHSCRHKRE